MALWKRKKNASAEENKEILEHPSGEEQKPKLPKKEKKPSKFLGFLRLVGVGILLLIIGATAVFFGIYTPKTNELNAQLTSAQDQITQLTTQVQELTAVQEELEQAKDDITSLQSDLDTTTALKVIYKIQSNVNTARIALEKIEPDATRAVQVIEYIIQDISGLSIASLPNISSDLNPRLEGIRTTIGSDPTKAATDLETLFNDLLLLANNLEKE